MPIKPDRRIDRDFRLAPSTPTPLSSAPTCRTDGKSSVNWKSGRGSIADESSAWTIRSLLSARVLTRSNIARGAAFTAFRVTFALQRTASLCSAAINASVGPVTRPSAATTCRQKMKANRRMRRQQNTAQACAGQRNNRHLDISARICFGTMLLLSQSSCKVTCGQYRLKWHYFSPGPNTQNLPCARSPFRRQKMSAAGRLKDCSRAKGTVGED